MSTGRRLAKRSIIGTKVLAPGPDGLLYTGTIDHIKSPPHRSRKTLGTKYTVSIEIRTTLSDIMQSNLDDIRANMPSTSQGSPGSRPASLSGVIMDGRATPQQRTNSLLSGSPAKQASLRRSVMIKEFRESEIYGPGFRDVNTVKLKPTQLVFLTYNSRECSGYVINHDQRAGEVLLRLNTEEQLDVKVPFEDVRLIESRKSARLADQVTDFALLADMGGDRRRTSSHNIDVPSTPQHNSRKRPPSFSEEERNNYLNQCRDDEEMKLCNAALTLMHLSGTPLSPKGYDSISSILASSPGSSSAWSSGSSSPPLSDDGRIFANHLLDSARNRTTSLSTSDEGIVVDFNYEELRRRRLNESITMVSQKPPPRPVIKRIFFRCTWRGCDYRERSIPGIERHIRDAHIGDDDNSIEKGASSDSEHEEEFYYTEVEEEDDEPQAPSPPSPPTLSHRDMARPPHEDPEYQRKIVGNFKQGLAQSHSVNSKYIQINNNGATNNQQYNTTNAISIPSSPLAHHNYTWPMPAQQQQQNNHHHNHQLQQSQHSPGSPMKHPRCSPRPSTSVAPYPSPNYVHHYHRNYSSSSSSSSSGSSGAGSPISNNSHIIHQVPHQTITISHPQQQSLLQQQQQQQNQQQQQQPHQHQQTPQQQYHQHHHQLMQHNIPSSTTVTISPNIHHTNNNHHPHPHSHHQAQQQMHHQHPHHHQQQQQQQQSPQQQQAQHYNHHRLHTASPASITATVTTTPTTTRRQSPNVQKKGTPNSPNRRTRGENKKCRKVYGMERREQWCTQCKWKKACSRFGD